MSLESVKPEKDWFIIFWMTLVHLLAIPAFFYVTPGAIAVGIFFYFLTGMIGITLGYHRLLTHRAFKAPKWVERFVTLCGTLALQGTALEWVGHHRMHHAGADSSNDPHDANRGFWFSHIGWLFIKDPVFDDEKRLRRFARDIHADPWLRFLSRKDVMIGLQVVLGMILLAIGGLSWMFWGVFLRLAVVYHVTWFVNSAAHMWGYKNYESDELARNNWWVALTSFGEGWHNNHHKHPDVCRAGIKWWEFDLTWQVIKVMRVLGWATDIKEPREEPYSPPAVSVTMPAESHS